MIKLRGPKEHQGMKHKKQSHLHWGMSLYKQNIFKYVNKIMIYKSISFLQLFNNPQKSVELHYYVKVCIEISHNIGKFSNHFKSS
jgi:hypothetical protein